MEKEQAIEMLDEYYTNQLSWYKSIGADPCIKFPRVDEIVFNTYNTSTREFKSYSFKHLIKIAYDLEDKKP